MPSIVVEIEWDWPDKEPMYNAQAVEQALNEYYEDSSTIFVVKDVEDDDGSPD